MIVNCAKCKKELTLPELLASAISGLPEPSCKSCILKEIEGYETKADAIKEEFRQSQLN